MRLPFLRTPWLENNGIFSDVFLGLFIESRDKSLSYDVLFEYCPSLIVMP
jgi:hypothetical protein